MSVPPEPTESDFVLPGGVDEDGNPVIVDADGAIVASTSWPMVDEDGNPIAMTAARLRRRRRRGIRLPNIPGDPDWDESKHYRDPGTGEFAKRGKVTPSRLKGLLSDNAEVRAEVSAEMRDRVEDVHAGKLTEYRRAVRMGNRDKAAQLARELRGDTIGSRPRKAGEDRNVWDAANREMAKIIPGARPKSAVDSKDRTQRDRKPTAPRKPDAVEYGKWNRGDDGLERRWNEDGSFDQRRTENDQQSWSRLDKDGNVTTGYGPEPGENERSTEDDLARAIELFDEAFRADAEDRRPDDVFGPDRESGDAADLPSESTLGDNRHRWDPDTNSWVPDDTPAEQIEQDRTDYIEATQQALVTAPGKATPEARFDFLDELVGDAAGSPIATDAVHDRIGPTGDWTPERAAEHEALLNDIVRQIEEAEVPRDRDALLMGGLPGSGKTTALDRNGAAAELGVVAWEPGDDVPEGVTHVVINSDLIKEEMLRRGMQPDLDGLTPMEEAGFIHYESGTLAELLGQRLVGDGYNVAFDGTMVNEDVVNGQLELLDAHGYDTPRALFTDIDVGESLDSVRSRYVRSIDDEMGGRFVSSGVQKYAVTDGDFRSRNREVFDKTKGRFRESLVVDNEGISDGNPRGEVVERNGGGDVTPDSAQKLADALDAHIQASQTDLPDQGPKDGTPHPELDLPDPLGSGDDNWKKLGGQGGSNPGGLFEDPDGRKFYVKQAKSNDHAANELAANLLYEAAGVEVPDVHRGTEDDMLASRIVPGELTDLSTGLQDPDIASRVREGMVVDAWLANWDVIGLTYDNIVIGEDGTPWRIDAGGGLTYRAMGAPKGNKFGPEVGELETLRNPQMNSKAGAVFQDITDAELETGARRVASVSPERIREIAADAGLSPEVADLLVARRADIIDKVLDGNDPLDSPTPDPVPEVDRPTPNIPDLADPLEPATPEQVAARAERNGITRSRLTSDIAGFSAGDEVEVHYFDEDMGSVWKPKEGGGHTSVLIEWENFDGFGRRNSAGDEFLPGDAIRDRAAATTGPHRVRAGLTLNPDSDIRPGDRVDVEYWSEDKAQVAYTEDGVTQFKLLNWDSFDAWHISNDEDPDLEPDADEIPEEPSAAKTLGELSAGDRIRAGDLKSAGDFTYSIGAEDDAVLEVVDSKEFGSGDRNLVLRDAAGDEFVIAVLSEDIGKEVALVDSDATDLPDADSPSTPPEGHLDMDTVAQIHDTIKALDSEWTFDDPDAERRREIAQSMVDSWTELIDYDATADERVAHWQSELDALNAASEGSAVFDVLEDPKGYLRRPLPEVGSKEWGHMKYALNAVPKQELETDPELAWRAAEIYGLDDRTFKAPELSRHYALKAARGELEADDMDLSDIQDVAVVVDEAPGIPAAVKATSGYWRSPFYPSSPDVTLLNLMHSEIESELGDVFNGGPLPDISHPAAKELWKQIAALEAFQGLLEEARDTAGYDLIPFESTSDVAEWMNLSGWNGYLTQLDDFVQRRQIEGDLLHGWWQLAAVVGQPGQTDQVDGLMKKFMVDNPGYRRPDHIQQGYAADLADSFGDDLDPDYLPVHPDVPSKTPSGTADGSTVKSANALEPGDRFVFTEQLDGVLEWDGGANIPHGAPVTVKAVSGDWYKVTNGSGSESLLHVLGDGNVKLLGPGDSDVPETDIPDASTGGVPAGALAPGDVLTTAEIGAKFYAPHGTPSYWWTPTPDAPGGKPYPAHWEWTVTASTPSDDVHAALKVSVKNQDGDRGVFYVQTDDVDTQVNLVGADPEVASLSKTSKTGSALKVGDVLTSGDIQEVYYNGIHHEYFSPNGDSPSKPDEQFKIKEIIPFAATGTKTMTVRSVETGDEYDFIIESIEMDKKIPVVGGKPPKPPKKALTVEDIAPVPAGPTAKPVETLEPGDVVTKESLLEAWSPKVANPSLGTADLDAYLHHGYPSNGPLEIVATSVHPEGDVKLTVKTPTGATEALWLDPGHSVGLHSPDGPTASDTPNLSTKKSADDLVEGDTITGAAFHEHPNWAGLADIVDLDKDTTYVVVANVPNPAGSNSRLTVKPVDGDQQKSMYYPPGVDAYDIDVASAAPSEQKAKVVEIGKPLIAVTEDDAFEWDDLPTNWEWDEVTIDPDEGYDAGEFIDPDDVEPDQIVLIRHIEEVTGTNTPTFDGVYQIDIETDQGTVRFHAPGDGTMPYSVTTDDQWIDKWPSNLAMGDTLDFGDIPYEWDWDEGFSVDDESGIYAQPDFYSSSDELSVGNVEQIDDDLWYIDLETPDGKILKYFTSAPKDSVAIKNPDYVPSKASVTHKPKPDEPPSVSGPQSKKVGDLAVGDEVNGDDLADLADSGWEVDEPSVGWDAVGPVTITAIDPNFDNQTRIQFEYGNSSGSTYGVDFTYISKDNNETTVPVGLDDPSSGTTSEPVASKTPKDLEPGDIVDVAVLNQLAAHGMTAVWTDGDVEIVAADMVGGDLRVQIKRPDSPTVDIMWVDGKKLDVPVIGPNAGNLPPVVKKKPSALSPGDRFTKKAWVDAGHPLSGNFDGLPGEELEVHFTEWANGSFRIHAKSVATGDVNYQWVTNPDIELELSNGFPDAGHPNPVTTNAPELKSVGELVVGDKISHLEIADVLYGGDEDFPGWTPDNPDDFWWTVTGISDDGKYIDARPEDDSESEFSEELVAYDSELDKGIHVLPAGGASTSSSPTAASGKPVTELEAGDVVSKEELGKHWMLSTDAWDDSYFPGSNGDTPLTIKSVSPPDVDGDVLVNVVDTDGLEVSVYLKPGKNGNVQLLSNPDQPSPKAPTNKQITDLKPGDELTHQTIADTFYNGDWGVDSPADHVYTVVDIPNEDSAGDWFVKVRSSEGETFEVMAYSSEAAKFMPVMSSDSGGVGDGQVIKSTSDLTVGDIVTLTPGTGFFGTPKLTTADTMEVKTKPKLGADGNYMMGVTFDGGGPEVNVWIPQATGESKNLSVEEVTPPEVLDARGLMKDTNFVSPGPDGVTAHTPAAALQRGDVINPDDLGGLDDVEGNVVIQSVTKGVDGAVSLDVVDSSAERHTLVAAPNASRVATFNGATAQREAAALEVLNDPKFNTPTGANWEGVQSDIDGFYQLRTDESRDAALVGLNELMGGLGSGYAQIVAQDPDSDEAKRWTDAMLWAQDHIARIQSAASTESVEAQIRDWNATGLPGGDPTEAKLGTLRRKATEANAIAHAHAELGNMESASQWRERAVTVSRQANDMDTVLAASRRPARPSSRRHAPVAPTVVEDKWGESPISDASYEQAFRDVSVDPTTGSVMIYGGGDLEANELHVRAVQVKGELAGNSPRDAHNFNFRLEEGDAETRFNDWMGSGDLHRDHGMIYYEEDGVVDLDRKAQVNGNSHNPMHDTRTRMKEVTLPDGRRALVIGRMNKGTGDHTTLARTVQVYLYDEGTPVSQDDVDALFAQMGLNTGYPSTETLRRQSSEAIGRLFSPSGTEDVDEGLERAESRFGITPADVVWERHGNSLMPLISEEQAMRIADAADFLDGGSFIKSFGGSAQVRAKRIVDIEGHTSNLMRGNNGKPVHHGMSLSEDYRRGGGWGVFTRQSDSPSGPVEGNTGVVMRGDRLLRRLDWYAYTQDEWGDNTREYRVHRDNVRNLKRVSGSRETIFRGGIPIEFWSHVTAGSDRDELIRILREDYNVDTINGLELEDFIPAGGGVPEREGDMSGIKFKVPTSELLPDSGSVPVVPAPTTSTPNSPVPSQVSSLKPGDKLTKTNVLEASGWTNEADIVLTEVSGTLTVTELDSSDGDGVPKVHVVDESGNTDWIYLNEDTVLDVIPQAADGAAAGGDTGAVSGGGGTV